MGSRQRLDVGEDMHDLEELDMYTKFQGMREGHNGDFLGHGQGGVRSSSEMGTIQQFGAQFV